MVRKLFGFFLLNSLLLVSTVDSSFAQTIRPPRGVPVGGMAKLQDILRVGLVLLFTVAVILSLIYVIWGGILWTMSGGDKEGLDKARKKITYAIIGLVVSLLAFFIVNVVGKVFGIPSLTLFTI